MILFTIDIDWAPEAVIEDTLLLFEQHSVPCTLFSTHKSSVITSINSSLFEVAIHPNFNPLFNGNLGYADKVLNDILNIHPNAKGVRSHSMTQNTPLLGLFKEKGLTYEANHFLPYWENIHAFKLWNGLIRIPYNWEDDIHFMYNKTFDQLELDTRKGDLHVFDFHPIHIYLNTDRESTYQNAKIHYQDADKLKNLRNTKKPGSRDALITLLEQNKGGRNSSTLINYATNKFSI